tara:strand:+ start:144 stop:941 length:798 start_codon:yes stop_codon:yes gene_type:complete
MDNFTLIAGPCVIENSEMPFQIAEEINKMCLKLEIDYIFKASFDKANRSSSESFRGLGSKKGLEILDEIKKSQNVKVLTDIHESTQADSVAEVVDVIQIPAFLCRQTDLLLAAAKATQRTNKVINIKKGQFLAPWDMAQVVKKMRSFGTKNLWLTERGSTFGYNNLVVDYRSLPQLKNLECPVIFDATHSVQQPGGKGFCSGGQREYVAPLARAAVAVGIDGIFLEVHPDPDNALSDGPNMIKLNNLEALLIDLINIRNSFQIMH